MKFDLTTGLAVGAAFAALLRVRVRSRREPAAAGAADPTVAKLRTGDTMPLVGLGTWKSKPGAVEAAVEAAIVGGYRHIDCAAVYANEHEVGAGIAAGLAAAGIARDALFVTSKLWNSEHHPDDVEAACRKTLADLGLAYLDMYLIHWPNAFARGRGHFPKNAEGKIEYATDIPPPDTWKAMERLVDKGLVRAIGLSNFNAAQIDAVFAVARIPPAVLQVECHPLLAQRPLIAHARKNGMVVTAYSPLGSGKGGLLTNEAVAKVAAAHAGRTNAHVLIRWQVQRGVVVIPKSVTPHRIAANFDVHDFVLSAQEMAALEGLNADARFVIPTIEVDGKQVPRDAAHPDFPFQEGVAF